MSAFKCIFFDVGLGDCSLIYCDNIVILIDGGGWFPDALKAFLFRNSIKSIDYVICTHFHSDHVDGLVEVMQKVRVKNVVCNTLDEDYLAEKTCSDFVELIEKQKARLICVEDEYVFSCEECVVRCIKPILNKNITDENCNSIVCHVSYRKTNILILSDLQSDGIDILLSKGIKADVVRTSHHGIDFISESFWKMVQAKYVVISYGRTRHGVVNAHLLEYLYKMNIQVYRTDINRDICCKVTGNDVKICSLSEMETDKDKRLLFLGANAETIPFVSKAKERGIYTIVTDNIIDSPAKKEADKYYDVDGKDLIALKNIVDNEHIDGVLVGVADPLVPTYMRLCEEMNLPYLPCDRMKEDSSFFTNKEVFKRECQSVGLNVVPEYFCGSRLTTEIEKKIVFPCIIKPACCRGGKGVSICNTFTDLKRAFDFARDCSDNGQVIIEAYMNMPDIIANFYFCDGSPYLLAVSDRITLAGTNRISPVTYGNRYPSRYSSDFEKKCLTKFINLFRKLRIRNGILEIQIFCDGKDYYPYDPACILGGELSSPIFSDVIGIDLINNFISYALYGNMNDTKQMSFYKNKTLCKPSQSVWILLKVGEIESIDGLEEVSHMRGVLKVLQRLFVGSVVTDRMFETEKAALARIWITANTEQQLVQLEKRIRSTIVVLDKDGSSLIWNGF